MTRRPAIGSHSVAREPNWDIPTKADSVERQVTASRNETNSERALTVGESPTCRIWSITRVAAGLKGSRGRLRLYGLCAGSHTTSDLLDPDLPRQRPFFSRPLTVLSTGEYTALAGLSLRQCTSAGLSASFIHTTGGPTSEGQKPAHDPWPHRVHPRGDAGCGHAHHEPRCA
jgi:hypothetical protein